MKNRSYLLLLLAGLILWPAGAVAQATADDRALLVSLLREVRLLRQSVERQAGSAVRIQMLATRLSAQQQRVSRAQDVLDRVADALAVAEGRQQETREAVTRVEADLAPMLQDLRRPELERQAARSRAELTAREAEVARLSDERDRAEQQLATEQRRYDELEAQLARLVR